MERGDLSRAIQEYELTRSFFLGVLELSRVHFQLSLYQKPVCPILLYGSENLSEVMSEEIGGANSESHSNTAAV